MQIKITQQIHKNTDLPRMSIIGKVLNSRDDEKNPISIEADKGSYLRCKNEEKNILLSTASFQTTG